MEWGSELLTARPWLSAVHGLPMVYWLFFSFVGDQTQTSSRPNVQSRNLWCLLAKSCWNINTRTMLRILFSLFVCKIYFLLVLSKHWIWREIINTLKKGITSAMECTDVAAFTFTTWQIRSCLLCKFISAEATLINLFAIFWVFLMVLGKWSKFFGCFIAVSSVIRRKIKYLQAKQRTCQNMQGLRHW